MRVKELASSVLFMLSLGFILFPLTATAVVNWTKDPDPVLVGGGRGYGLYYYDETSGWHLLNTVLPDDMKPINFYPFSKCGLLETACTSFELVAPAWVVQETASKELAGKYSDAAFIRDLAARRLLRIEKPTAAQARIPLALHRGEKEALLLALSLPDSVLATDDGKAIRAARLMKVPFVITPRIVVALFRLGKISTATARTAIQKLGIVGRYSPGILAEAILSLTEAKDGKTNNNTGA
jgi:predicted nucleic acid-binding protein